MHSWLTKLFGGATSGSAPIYFHNTLGDEKQLFEPPTGRPIRVYTCGPTPYDRMHIGNLLPIVFADTLRRVLEYNNLSVKYAHNITDFGHLVSDADEGEDKMMKGLRREGKEITMENMRALTDKYVNMYFEDSAALGVSLSEFEFPRASEYIDSQIALIKTLEEKGYAYKIDDGMYFETSRFAEYGALGGIDTNDQSTARIKENSQKRGSNDFALWKFNDALGWDSPWGKGFPGWHIECSGMIRSVLGERIDIHTGGPEHISIHHNNEIAQSEAATGKKPFARFWLHSAHIQLDGGKMAKSEGNVVYVSDLTKKGFHPLAYRYLLLTGHYRTHRNFTWEALGGAQTALVRLHKEFNKLPEGGIVSSKWEHAFHERINDDLDIPGAIATLWEMLKDEKVSDIEKRATLLKADEVLGLQLAAPDEKLKELLGDSEISMPDEVQKLVAARDVARSEQDWKEADELRDKITALGYGIKDTDDGTRVHKL